MYEKWSSALAAKANETAPLLSLRASGKELWANEHTDDYVRRVLKGWG